MRGLILIDPKNNYFNWFDCGVRYFSNGEDKIRLSTKNNFYDSESGRVYQLKEPTDLNMRENIYSDENCTSSRLVCCGYKFNIDDSKLEEVDEMHNKILRFAKRYNDRLRRENPSFPRCEEIDSNITREIFEML